MLIEKRNGIIVDALLTRGDGRAERDCATCEDDLDVKLSQE